VIYFVVGFPGPRATAVDDRVDLASAEGVKAKGQLYCRMTFKESSLRRLISKKGTGDGGASKGSRMTLPRWQQWEKIGDLAGPATRSARQSFAPQKRQVASIRPNEGGPSEFEDGRRAIGNHGDL